MVPVPPRPHPCQMLSSLGVQQHTSALEMISTPRLPPVPGHDLVAFRSPKESFAPSVPPARQAGSVVDLEALWEKGTGWILGRWRYSEADQEELRKQRAKDARIRSEFRRTNEEASYEPVPCGAQAGGGGRRRSRRCLRPRRGLPPRAAGAAGAAGRRQPGARARTRGWTARRHAAQSYHRRARRRRRTKRQARSA